ncbi:hypothetical protein [uncultured Endozoicomonas sp.]|uniref:hypothetical protein n=1 Tax=uncultured Endozoicomonas sp. TaxID=432652 RepID=UPI0026385F0D|nr:hypothetical protein [uncultured Endozoicomonas sp.]
MLFAIIRHWPKWYLSVLLTVTVATSDNAYSWFEFSSDQYSVTADWNDENIEKTIPFSLRSCFGLSADWCDTWWLTGKQNYFLTASDFNLTYEGSYGPDPKERSIAEVIFQQGTNTSVLNDGVEAGSFDPDSTDFVEAALTFRVLNQDLFDALPGKYQATINLYGIERDDNSSFDDTTQFDVTIKIPERMKISGLKDIELTSNGNNNVSSAWINFCVFSQGGLPFQLRAYGSNATDRFVLKQSPTSGEITYRLLIRASDGSNRKNIQPNPVDGSSSAYQWAGATTPDCSNGNNMSLRVRVNGNSEPSGVYSDVVTVVVEPPA